MEIIVLSSADAVAAEAAALIAQDARDVVRARGRFVLAVSGGRTPWQMLRALAREDVPWSGVHIVQVDERIAPAGDADRNLMHLHASLLENSPIPIEQIHAMPVEANDLDAAAAQYDRMLAQLCGEPPEIDLVHLGMGPDGHTASLIPGDPVLDVANRDVALTGLYQGRRRMTLTYPIINRARKILWLITGADKADRLPQLRAGDATIPAGRVNQSRATVIADHSAAAKI
ncbi:MAG: 6-phosphogluconolactonase [Pirellulales bacterium]